MAARTHRFTIRALLLAMVWLGLCMSAWKVLWGWWFVLWTIVVAVALVATLPRMR